jgi:uncharacterized membrane protein YbaN (DUF454 family)
MSWQLNWSFENDTIGLFLTDGRKREPMMALARKTLIHLVGWSFILLGIVGLFLPILQGILFLLIGLLVLSKESRFAKDLLHRIEKRYPDQHRKVHEFNERLKNRIRRFLKN